MRSISDCGSSAAYGSDQEEMVITKGPWTEEEDSVLINYITLHGEGHWNLVARFAGLKRTGKSCRLRWLNYLRPSVRRGNITLQEQLLILELHSRWGNRWSKIAQQLPGRTDNEIKNYWRTRVVKQAKQLRCDINSKQFRDTLRFVWIPRMLERIQASSGSGSAGNCDAQPTFSDPNSQHPCEANNYPSLLSSTVEVEAPYDLPVDCTLSYNLISTGGTGTGSCLSYNADESPYAWQQREYSDIQAIKSGNGFDGADLWTDENIWFLQQQLADDGHL